MSEVVDIVGDSPAVDSPAVDTDATVAIVWADGTYTTDAGTFHGGREEAMATVALVQALEGLES